MKNVLKLCLVLTLLFLPTKIYAAEENVIEIHYFYDRWCDNCQAVSDFLEDDILSDYDVILTKYDVHIQENDDLFKEVLETYDLSYHYPLMVIGGTVIQGSVDIQSSLADVIEYYRDLTDYVDVVEKLNNHETILDSDIIANPSFVKHISIFGWHIDIDIRSFSLLLGAIIIGLVDGFNPCAMWVLVFLITMLINLKNRKRIWLLGSTFIFVSGLIYFAIMMAWLQIVTTAIQKQVFQLFIGSLALIFAFFSIRHFWRARNLEVGCEVTDEKQRSKLMKRIESVVKLDRLWLAVVGVIGIAVTVNILELACSAGLPLIYTSMLGYQGISSTQSVLYILIYVIFFILDDMIIFVIAIITFRVTGLSNKYAKYSNLIGGLIMLFIGLALIFFPQWLF
jgi:hypothetical protein